MLSYIKLLFSCGVIASLLFLSNCKKKDGQAAPVTKEDVLNATLAGYYNFDKGSFWMYTDSITGRTDKIAVDTNVEFIQGSGAMNNMVVYNTIYLSEKNMDLSTQPICAAWTFYLFDSTFSLSYFDSTSEKMECDYHNLCSMPFSNDTHITNIYPTMTVHGKTYNNVAEVHQGNDCFFICNDAGIIKMRLNHPDDGVTYVWELTSNNIIIKKNY